MKHAGGVRSGSASSPSDNTATSRRVPANMCCHRVSNMAIIGATQTRQGFICLNIVGGDIAYTVRISIVGTDSHECAE